MKLFASSWFNRELETHKQSLASTFNREKLIHTKEFEVLSEIWKRIVISHRLAKRAVSLVKFYPDISTMSNQSITEYFSNQSYTINDDDLDKLLTLKDETKQTRFCKLIDFHSLRSALQNFQTTYEYFEENRIFFETKILKELEYLLKDFQENLISYDTYNSLINDSMELSSIMEPQKMEAAKKLLYSFESKFVDISILIQNRLRVNTTT